jgi:hypothetical protein
LGRQMRKNCNRPNWARFVTSFKFSRIYLFVWLKEVKIAQDCTGLQTCLIPVDTTHTQAVEVCNRREQCGNCDVWLSWMWLNKCGPPRNWQWNVDLWSDLHNNTRKCAWRRSSGLNSFLLSPFIISCLWLLGVGWGYVYVRCCVCLCAKPDDYSAPCAFIIHKWQLQKSTAGCKLQCCLVGNQDECANRKNENRT